jgi:hypothetical protein
VKPALGAAAEWDFKTQPMTNPDQNMQIILETLKQKSNQYQ